MVQITIHEGKNHQVKKMFEAVGNNGLNTPVMEKMGF